MLIAFSGGVDSTFLLKVAQEVLGNRVIAVTAASLTFPSGELEYARRLAKTLGCRHIIIKTSELSDSRFTNNSFQRCYWCKRELFSRLITLAKKYNLNYVLDGSHYGDIGDFRPGMRAARELKISSPLKEVGFTKEEIRSLSRGMGLPTWNRPSLACLASRFPYGVKITKEDLIRVDKAEKILRTLGMRYVRVRHYNSRLARIEVLQEDISKLVRKSVRQRIINELKNLGYMYVTVDLQGYRTGSLNKTSQR